MDCVESAERIKMAQDEVQLQGSVYTLMNFRVPQNQKIS
jgi:hypothetical protein